MHNFNDRLSILTIHTAKKPSLTAYRKAPAILMAPSCGFPLNLSQADQDAFLRHTREAGYLATPGHEFFRHGKIDCSDPNRQVSVGLLYYCLIGEASQHVGADPNSPIYRPENAPRYLTLDYLPSPDDLLWKPYRIRLGMAEVCFDFMAPNPKSPNKELLTTSLTFQKLAFQFEFSILYPARNERENYICRWSPLDYPYGSRAPFSIHYELIFNTGPVATGIASRTIEYKTNPGVRSLTPISNIRIYDREVHVLE